MKEKTLILSMLLLAAGSFPFFPIALADDDEISVIRNNEVCWAVLGPIQPVHQELAKRFQRDTGNRLDLVGYDQQSDLLDILLEKKPDIISMTDKTAIDYIDIGVLADVKPYFKGRDNFLGEVMTQFGRNFTKKGKTYALPFWGNLITLNYNKLHFQNAGMQEPQASWKYDNEFYAAMKKLTRDANGDKRPEQYGMVGGVHNQWLPVFYSWGAEFLSMDGLKLMFTDKNALDSLGYIDRLHKEGIVEVRDPQAEFDPGNGPFADGRSSMIMDFRLWDQAYIKRIKGARVDPDYTSTPTGRKGSISAATSSAVGMYVQSPNKKGAAELLKFLFKDENQILMYQEGGGFPTRKGTLKLARLDKASGLRNDPLVTSYEKAQVMGADDISQLILENLKYGIHELVHNGKSPAQLMQEVKDEFFRYIKGKN